MHTLFSQAKGVVGTSGTTTINFAKWTEFHTSIKDVFQYKPPDVSKYRQTTAGVLAYLEHELYGISVSSTMDQDLEKLSNKLYQNEDLLRQMRVPEYNAVGWS
jgi:hypothetical protein